MSEPQIPRRPDAECFQVNEKTLEKRLADAEERERRYASSVARTWRPLCELLGIGVWADFSEIVERVRALKEAAQQRVGETLMRRVTVYRRGDLSATHDANQANEPDKPQYEAVVFTDGKVAQRWLTPVGSVAVWNCLADMLAIHGHQTDPRYQTVYVWHDGEPVPQPQAQQD